MTYDHPPADIRLRILACAACDDMRAITLDVTRTVRCAACGCGAKRFDDRCPRGKWPELTRGEGNAKT